MFSEEITTNIKGIRWQQQQNSGNPEIMKQITVLKQLLVAIEQDSVLLIWYVSALETICALKQQRNLNKKFKL